MKALSVRQPWAVALAMGGKAIEFRSKPTKHRGKLLICSSKSGFNVYNEINGKVYPQPKGAMVGVVEVVDCRPTTDDDLQVFGAPESKDGWYSWVINPEVSYLVLPKEIKGKVALFNVDDELIEPMPHGKLWVDYDYPNKHDKVPDADDLVGMDEYID